MLIDNDILKIGYVVATFFLLILLGLGFQLNLANPSPNLYAYYFSLSVIITGILLAFIVNRHIKINILHFLGIFLSSLVWAIFMVRFYILAHPMTTVQTKVIDKKEKIVEGTRGTMHIICFVSLDVTGQLEKYQYEIPCYNGFKRGDLVELHYSIGFWGVRGIIKPYK